MSDNIKLYGFIISGVPGEGGYEFEFGDIYLTQSNKWLKEMSSNFSKLNANIELLKIFKSLTFYTKSVNGSRYTSLGIRYLKDFVENLASRQKIFTLKLVAVSGGNSIIATFSDCELSQSTMLPTPIGTVQCYRVGFKAATVENLAASPGMR